MSTVKVGDEIAFRVGHGKSNIRIHTVTKITPTGIIKCGPYSLDPSLRVKGPRDRWIGPFTGEVVTDALRDEMHESHRRGVALAACQEMQLNMLSTDKLERIAAILQEG